MLGTLHPARARGVAALAAGHSKEEYDDSNTLWNWDVGAPFVDPRLRALLLATVAEHAVDRAVCGYRDISWI